MNIAPRGQRNNPCAVGSFVIAIDGPSGTGKSTVARRVAGELGAGYLDTGAMYRVVTLAVLRAGIDPVDDCAVATVLRGLEFSAPLSPENQQYVLAAQDVTDEIRDQPVTLAVTPVSANPGVRAWLFERQQSLAHSGRMVVEGRDIGTVIAPDADLKIYLTADAGERARRRHRQDTAGTQNSATATGFTADIPDVTAVEKDLHRRDTHDSNRAHAPLQAADDAVVVDSSGLELPQTLAKVLELIASRGIR